MRLGLKALLLPLGAAMLLNACNSDSDDSNTNIGYVEPTDMAVTGFSIKADTRILSGLDTVFFSIDLNRGIIYNADSLPKGTRVTDLIPVIKYSNYVSSATIKMEGGSKRTGEFDYRNNPNDSVDFTGDVTLTLTTTTGNSRTYDLKVNVHTTEPDSLCWSTTAMSALPSRGEAPRAQRTVTFGGRATCLIQEKDGSYTLATTTDPYSAPWTRQAVQLPFTPKVRSFTASDENLWLLAEDGLLYCSSDGLNWQPTTQRLHNILCGYGSSLLGIERESNSYYITDATGALPRIALPEGFPIEDFSNTCSYQSKWMQQPVSLLCGGVTANGHVSSAVWAFDGTSWATLNSNSLPALRGSVLVPYYTYRRTGSSWIYSEFSTLFMIGGMDADGALNRETYISYDNGVSWAKAPALLRMPEFIPASWQLDQTVLSQPMQADLIPTKGWSEMPERRLPGWYRVATQVDGNLIRWECPYIYLFGGCDAEGALHNTIWRGLINRLSFTPII